MQIITICRDNVLILIVLEVQIPCKKSNIPNKTDQLYLSMNIYKVKQLYSSLEEDIIWFNVYI